MRCGACHKRLSCYVDAELSGRDRREVEAHLASCGGCRAELERLRALRRAFADLPGATPVPFFYERLAGRLRAEEAAASAWAGWRVFGRLASAAVFLIAFLGLSFYWVERHFDPSMNGIVARYLEHSSEEDAMEVAAIYQSEVSRDAMLKMVMQKK